MIAAVAYVVLAVLVVARLVLFPRLLFADLTSHAKGFAFLTIVAGTNVLGGASATIHGWWGLARGLWWCSIVLWAVLAYTTLIAVVLRRDKPGIAAVNGTWFLLTVSVESIAVVGALLLARDGSDLLAFTCLAAFTLGVVLYLIVMTLVFSAVDAAPTRSHRSRPAGLDRGRRSCDHRARRFHLVVGSGRCHRGSNASHRSSRVSSSSPGRRRRSGSR